MRSIVADSLKGRRTTFGWAALVDLAHLWFKGMPVIPTHLPFGRVCQLLGMPNADYPPHFTAPPLDRCVMQVHGF